VFLPFGSAQDAAAVLSTPNPIRELHALIERRIEASGLEWTFLRRGRFAANSLVWGRCGHVSGFAHPVPNSDQHARGVHVFSIAWDGMRRAKT